ncbi:hypothetical protein UT300003_32830 [Clostridium sardiniense]
MRNFENANRFKREGIKPHQILVTITSEPDYEMYKNVLLADIEGLECDEYLLLNGYHCSCYDFDETDWEGTVYTSEELKKLAQADYNKNNLFWKEVLKHI